MEAFGLVCLYGFTAIDDMKTKRVKMWVIVAFALFGILINIISKSNSLISVLGGVGVGILLLIFSVLTKEKIGKGDAYILMVTGIYLGFINTIVLLWLSSILAAIYGIIEIRKYDNDDKAKIELPFIPFLLLGYMLLLVIQGIGVIAG